MVSIKLLLLTTLKIKYYLKFKLGKIIKVKHFINKFDNIFSILTAIMKLKFDYAVKNNIFSVY